MNALLVLMLGLLAWSGAMFFLAWHIWIAPEGFEDAAGFHRQPATSSSASRHSVRFHHARRSHRRLRHAHGF